MVNAPSNAYTRALCSCRAIMTSVDTSHPPRNSRPRSWEQRQDPAAFNKLRVSETLSDIRTP
jgi:hypothetical protein